MTWDEIINHPALRDLPFKIETNKFGQILMSPASNKKGMLKFQVGCKIDHQQRGGTIITGCSIETSDGIKVADVAWASDDFIREFGDVTPYPKAPEICVEVVSPSKQEFKHKIDLYLAKGALEVWRVKSKDEITFYTHTGKLKKSRLVPKLKF